jgi:hypothetical protein
MNSTVTVTPAIFTVASKKSTSASAPGSLTCGTMTSGTPKISRLRRPTYLRTVGSATSTSSSSRIRSQIRCAVCRCLRSASRSASGMPSMNGRSRPITGASRSGTFRSGSTDEVRVCRTVRRLTRCTRAS